MTSGRHNVFHPMPPVVRWVFKYDRELLTCRVDQQTTGRYSLTVIPETLSCAARVVVYERATEALRQHAAIAAALRDLGWMVVEYTTVDTPDPAHSQDAAA